MIHMGDAQQDWPPLLPSGLHEMTIAEMRALCVDKFPLSSTRKRLMDGLEEVLQKIHSCGVKTTIWVDGSFLTLKIDPADTDIVFIAEASIYNSNTKYRSLLDWVITSEPFDKHGCHAYTAFPTEEEGDLKICWEVERAYWLDQYGYGRDKVAKGIAVLTIGDSHEQHS